MLDDFGLDDGFGPDRRCARGIDLGLHARDLCLRRCDALLGLVLEQGGLGCGMVGGGGGLRLCLSDAGGHVEHCLPPLGGAGGRLLRLRAQLAQLRLAGGRIALDGRCPGLCLAERAGQRRERRFGVSGHRGRIGVQGVESSPQLRRDARRPRQGRGLRAHAGADGAGAGAGLADALHGQLHLQQHLLRQLRLRRLRGRAPLAARRLQQAGHAVGRALLVGQRTKALLRLAHRGRHALEWQADPGLGRAERTGQRAHGVLGAFGGLAHCVPARLQRAAQGRRRRVELDFQRRQRLLHQRRQLLTQAFAQRLALQLRQACIGGGAQIGQQLGRRRQRRIERRAHRGRERLAGSDRLPDAILHVLQHLQQGLDRLMHRHQRLVDQRIERLHQRHRHGHLRIGGVARGLHRRRGHGNTGMQARNHLFDTHKQDPCQHQGRRLYLVLRAHANGVGAQRVGLDQLVVGAAQRPFAAHDERRNLVPDPAQQLERGGDRGAHLLEVRRQIAQRGLGLLGLHIEFAQQLQHLGQLVLECRKQRAERAPHPGQAGIERVEWHQRAAPHGVDAGAGLHQARGELVGLGARHRQRLAQLLAGRDQARMTVVEQRFARLRFALQIGPAAVEQANLVLEWLQQGRAFVVQHAQCLVDAGAGGVDGGP